MPVRNGAFSSLEFIGKSQKSVREKGLAILYKEVKGNKRTIKIIKSKLKKREMINHSTT